MNTAVIRPQKRVYSVSEAAEVLGISRSRMYELVKIKGFPMFNVGTRILVSIKGLERWIDEQAGILEKEDPT